MVVANAVICGACMVSPFIASVLAVRSENWSFKMVSHHCMSPENSRCRGALCRLGFVGVACIGLLLSGCSGKPAGNFKGSAAQPAFGEVSVDGKPAAGVNVTLVPVGGAKDGSPCAAGMTDKDGRFTLTTYAPKDGAPVGDYQITLSWIERIDKTSGLDAQPPEAQRLPRKFQSPTLSGLTAKVETGPNNLPPITVSTQVVAGPTQYRRAERD